MKRAPKLKKVYWKNIRTLYIVYWNLLMLTICLYSGIVRAIHNTIRKYLICLYWLLNMFLALQKIIFICSDLCLLQKSNICLLYLHLIQLKIILIASYDFVLADQMSWWVEQPKVLLHNFVRFYSIRKVESK